MDRSPDNGINKNFAFDSLQTIRNRLLDLTGRNRLLNFRYGKSGFVRVIDEMPDQLAVNILDGRKFTFVPVDEPTKDELIEHGYISIKEDGQEVTTKSNPTAKEWAKIKGINAAYELPKSEKIKEPKHDDTNIQSLLFPRELEAQLRKLHDKATLAIEETGANILYLAFGFLEWYEDESSITPKEAPLFLLPVKINKASLNVVLSTYTYTIEHTGEDIISNLSLREKLKHDFHLLLPEIEDGMLPESYLELVEKQLKKNKPAWSVKRNATLSLFDFGKLLMYLDLDPSRWPSGANNIQNHAIIQQFFTKEGNAKDSSGLTFFGTEYEIDALENVHELYPLIDDADSSQHSALVDAIKGKNLVIEGPPGSGKSQTITNLIAAAIAQGKKVLFVAEKMAALQVVQSRLTRAGLGDFCLELHSNKTQKKQVYENLKKRLEEQKNYRDPESIKVDIQMYEGKKETLSQHSELINSTWKKSGKTIHQILTAAARYREEFSAINLEEIKPINFNGENFDELEGRRISDELRRYAYIFNEVKNQLGKDSLLSDHPWFGVYNKNIQVFECEEVCNALKPFHEATESVINDLENLSKKLSIELPKTRRILKSLTIDFRKLPELNGNEDFSALHKISDESEKTLLNYIAIYDSARNLYSELAPIFEENIFQNNISLIKLQNALGDVQGNLKYEHFSPNDIYKQLKLVQSYKDLSLSINEDLNSVVEQDPTLAGLVIPSANGFNEFESFLKFFDLLDPSLVSRRDDLFDNDHLDIVLSDLNALLGKIKPLQTALEPFFKLNETPSSSELKELANVLNDKSLLRWFKKSWREAKNKIFGFSIPIKPRINELIFQLQNLIQYKEFCDQLSDNSFKTHLKHEFNGIKTPIEQLHKLRFWYRSVRDRYGIGFGKKVVFANAIFRFSDSTFKGIQHLAKSKSLPSLDQFSQLNDQLGSVFKSDIINDRNYNLVSQNGIEQFCQSLETSTRTLQSLCKIEISINELNSKVSNLSQLIEMEKNLNNDKCSSILFGEGFSLSSRKNCESAKQVINTTLNLYRKLMDLNTISLKSYLLANISVQKLDSIRDSLKLISERTTQLSTNFNIFKERVELDSAAWFQSTGDNLLLWKKKSYQALSKPRWLSTWIDFVRIRESLSNAGLDNLLRSIENGKIDLNTIEQLYLYLVFDSLSREILNENHNLAYFSGPNQNAIREQFCQYDTKLKKLQQEKIAFQIAQNGKNQVLPGISSGKVSSYSEMGLINHEINKKTRHTPIRQLINRSGKSLIALKPCFMMGPHSVAQYLEPGQIEFDLVVMDEASQIKPEDALGTIARGRQLIVVGDPKQLPPTSFFEKTVEDESADVTAIEQSESILDVSLPIFDARRLRWHYRSRHESLIAFSNQEFYDNNLVVFPSPSERSNEFGIKFTYVKTGRFINQHNIEEAKVIAEAVRRHLLNNPKESLGVVAMSTNQREQIDRCVEELSKDDELFRDVYEKNKYSDEPFFLKNLENVQGDERDVIFISCTYGPKEAGAAQMPQRFGPINSASGGRRLNVLFTRSKKRMHVFSSMTEGHILVNPSSSAGVRALKSFLNFAQTGRLPQIKSTGKEPDSDFEIGVMNALKLHGFECEPQVGVAGYFIDLAVKDPGQPGRYLMAIECDGATYHSAKSARDRDRLRQSVLESLGWNVTRIWSTDWFKNPQAQIKPIIALLNQLKTDVHYEPEMDTSSFEIERDVDEEAQIISELTSFNGEQDTLEAKLKEFDSRIIAKSKIDVPQNSSILRPAMIDALCEFKPITKSAFQEDIPLYLRKATAKEHGIYLDQILTLIAENEEELTTADPNS